MRKTGWLRRCRVLAIENDSQSPGLDHLGAVWKLLRSGALPRLTHLTCHELATDRFLAALAGWGGLERLEQLDLSDDYYGRLAPSLLDSPHLTERLSSLHGVRFGSDEDADKLAGCERLSGLREMTIAFVADLSAAATERLFRCRALRHVETLWLGFRSHAAECRQMPARVYSLLASSTVLPRLRTLVTWCSEQSLLQQLSRRLGPRLKP
jgi:hypothetical protein